MMKWKRKEDVKGKLQETNTLVKKIVTGNRNAKDTHKDDNINILRIKQKIQPENIQI